MLDSSRVIPDKVAVLTNISQSARTSSSLLCDQLEILCQILVLSDPTIHVIQATKNWLTYNLTIDPNRAGDTFAI